MKIPGVVILRTVILCVFLGGCNAKQSVIPVLNATSQLGTRTKSADVRGDIEYYSYPRMGFLMSVSFSAPGKDSGDKLYVEIITPTQIYSATSIGYQKASASDLKLGQTVEVLIDYELGVRTSYPAQVYAKEILIIK